MLERQPLTLTQALRRFGKPKGFADGDDPEEPETPDDPDDPEEPDDDDDLELSGGFGDFLASKGGKANAVAVAAELYAKNRANKRKAATLSRKLSRARSNKGAAIPDGGAVIDKDTNALLERYKAIGTPEEIEGFKTGKAQLEAERQAEARKGLVEDAAGDRYNALAILEKLPDDAEVKSTGEGSDKKTTFKIGDETLEIDQYVDKLKGQFPYIMFDKGSRRVPVTRQRGNGGGSANTQVGDSARQTATSAFRRGRARNK